MPLVRLVNRKQAVKHKLRSRRDEVVTMVGLACHWASYCSRLRQPQSIS